MNGGLGSIVRLHFDVGGDDVLLDQCRVPAPGYVPLEELPCHFVVIFCFCILAVVVPHESVDYASHHCNWVGG